MSILKYLFLIVSFILFSGCASSQINYDEKSKILSLKINEQLTKTVKFKSPIYRNYGGQCIRSSYVLLEKNLEKYGLVYIRHIEIANECEWNGLPSGYLKKSINSIYKEKILELINKENIGNYEFSKYLLSNNKEISVIEIWGASGDTFIIDSKGILSLEIKKELSK